MSDIERVDKIAAKLIHSFEEILKYTQLNNTPELVKNNTFEADDDADEDYNDDSFEAYSDDEMEGEQGNAENAHNNDITTRNLLRNINAKRHEISSIDSIEQVQVVHKHAKNVVKSLQELLLITRQLKESWILEYNAGKKNIITDEQLQKATEENNTNKEYLKTCIHDVLANI